MKKNYLKSVILFCLIFLFAHANFAQVTIIKKIPVRITTYNLYPEYGPDFLHLYFFKTDPILSFDNQADSQIKLDNIKSVTDTSFYVETGIKYIGIETGANIATPKFYGASISKIGYDTIQINPETSVTMTIYSLNLKEKSIECGTKVQLDVDLQHIDSTAAVKFKWSPSFGLNNDTIPNPIATALDIVTYKVSVSNGTNLYEDSATLYPKAFTMGFSTEIAYMQANKPIDLGSPTNGGLIDNYTGLRSDLKYKWYPAEGLSDATVRYPKVNVKRNTMYHLTTTTPGGCEATDSLKVCLSPIIIYSSVSSTSAQCGDTLDLIPSFDLAGLTLSDFIYDWGVDSNSLILGNFTTTGIPYAKKIVNGDCSIKLKIKPIGYDLEATYPFEIKLIPGYAPEIGFVSVENDKNVIHWNNSSGKRITYNVYKESFITDDYRKVGEFVSGNGECTFVDTLSDARISSDKYKISGLDDCGYNSLASIPHKTLHLSINRGLNKSINLIWESYSGATVNYYSIYRGTTADNLTLFANVSASKNQYTDLDAPADVYYLIETQISKPSGVSSILYDKAPNASQVEYFTSRSNKVAFFSSSTENLTENKISVAPNPATDYIRIKNTDSSEMNISIIDATGRELKRMTTSDTETTIHLEQFPSGLYSVRVNGENHKIIVK